MFYSNKENFLENKFGCGWNFSLQTPLRVWKQKNYAFKKNLIFFFLLHFISIINVKTRVRTHPPSRTFFFLINYKKCKNKREQTRGKKRILGYFKNFIYKNSNLIITCVRACVYACVFSLYLKILLIFFKTGCTI